MFAIRSWEASCTRPPAFIAESAGRVAARQVIGVESRNLEGLGKERRRFKFLGRNRELEKAGKIALHTDNPRPVS